jgi:putative DNA primase/helicase
MSIKPFCLALKLENIPRDLQNTPRWVLWRLEPRTKKDGSVKWDKVPYSLNGFRASTTNQSHWSSFEQVKTAFLLDDYDGIGIVINGKDFQGIDLDDCRNPETGELNEFAKNIMSKIPGYTEVSPSGTGIKILARTNLDRSRAKAHIEVYKENRFFTITGHVINGHSYLNDEAEDITWLIESEFGEPISEPENTDDIGALALTNLRVPLDGWGVDRVRDEVLGHLSPDLPYAEWLSVGMALHHQGGGDPEWLDLWDSWSADGATYVEGECARKWTSFSQIRISGTGPVTLRHLLRQTQSQRAASVIDDVESLVSDIQSVSDVRELETNIAKKVSSNNEISGTDRERIAVEIRKKANELGLSLPIGTIRNWLKPKLSRNFPHLSPDGIPLGTIENTKVLLANMQTTVRYNVISKQLEILIPGQGYTRDNQANATIARILSEASRVGMNTKYTIQYLWEIADNNAFNPAKTWIESKPWDGVSRIDAFLATIESSDPPAYKKLVLEKWMVQAVAAAVSPNGIAAQGMLVFQGPQGIGKTRWLLSLAPPLEEIIHTGFVIDTKSKDSMLLGNSHWLVEFGELNSSLARSDHASLKAYLTQPYDKIRRPYALTESIYPRRMSPYASINDNEFLIDSTGNRRFWTIAIKRLNLEHGIDMQQVWAEFYVRYQQGETYYLSREDMLIIESQNSKFRVSDPIEERIVGAYDWNAANIQWGEASATDVLIRLGISNPTKSQAMAASTVIRKLNGDQSRRSNGRRLLRIPKQNAEAVSVTPDTKADPEGDTVSGTVKNEIQK